MKNQGERDPFLKKGGGKRFIPSFAGMKGKSTIWEKTGIKRD